MYWSFAVVFFWSSMYSARLRISGSFVVGFWLGVETLLVVYSWLAIPGRQLDHVLYLRFVNIGEGLLLTLGRAIVRRYECYDFFGRFANSKRTEVREHVGRSS